MLKYVLLVIGLMFSLASSANAATVILKNYKAHQNDDLYKAYLDGLREGLIAFNEELAFTGQQRRFCMPRNLARTVEQADDIMMREAAKMNDPDRLPIFSYSHRWFERYVSLRRKALASENGGAGREESCLVLVARVHDAFDGAMFHRLVNDG
jgi:hypothetical protein